MSTYIRGGLWTSVEDEILKATVAKYGLQQWPRIASHLVRKTAKQCKVRWQEWLDPRINKQEWSSFNDNELLRLQRAMPNMWKTIARILGRTATQILERYQFLVSEDTKPDTNKSTFAEAKPALPAPEELEEDEEEMLAELRARLANTQGKKAKRKTRERYIEQQARLSALESRRKARESGERTQKLKKKQSLFSIDYNEAVPFQRQVPKGPFDVDQEEMEDQESQKTFLAEISAEGKTMGPARDKDPLSESERKRRKIQGDAAKAQSLLAKTREHKMQSRQQLVLPPIHIQEIGTFDAYESLLKGLALLPQPKNDYELEPPPEPVLPETFPWDAPTHTVVVVEPVSLQLAQSLVEQRIQKHTKPHPKLKALLNSVSPSNFSAVKLSTELTRDVKRTLKPEVDHFAAVTNDLNATLASLRDAQATLRSLSMKHAVDMGVLEARIKAAEHQAFIAESTIANQAS